MRTGLKFKKDLYSFVGFEGGGFKERLARDLKEERSALDVTPAGAILCCAWAERED
eukprot:gene11406-biopygen808